MMDDHEKAAMEAAIKAYTREKREEPEAFIYPFVLGWQAARRYVPPANEAEKLRKMAANFTLAYRSIHGKAHKETDYCAAFGCVYAPSKAR